MDDDTAIEADRLCILCRERAIRRDMADWSAAETSPVLRIGEIDNRNYPPAVTEPASAAVYPTGYFCPVVAIVQAPMSFGVQSAEPVRRAD